MSPLVPLDTFLDETSAQMRDAGFDPDRCLAVTATCRDEILAPLRAGVRERWHRAFDFSSLSGLPLAGVTGADAALSHAPVVDDQVHLVVFALPHVGVLPNGTTGQVRRRGHDGPTTACGSLIAAVAWAAEADRTMSEPIIDPQDPEQSLVRNRLLQADPYLGDADLTVVTALVRQLMVDGLRDIFLRPWRTAIRLAIVSGVVVHRGDGDLVDPAPSFIGSADPTEP